ncbi:MAG: GH92 family glycosyl hydrolase [Tidjanibacter sp.]|nr:GH92 family glycosyl hydrolase [Tidjanibacter sp.]
MNRLLVIVLALNSLGCRAEAQFEPVDYVSTLVGTESKYELSTGNTYPAVARPWGMNFWTPQTGTMGDGWAYTYSADKIRGFKQTHQPSPWINDYGSFAIMPVTSGKTFDQKGRASWFSHKTETAKPYYYGVYLADADCTTEITPTRRAAMFRFTFPESDCSYIVVDPFKGGSMVEIDSSKGRITGYTTQNSGGVPDNFRSWFVIECDTPIEWVATSNGNRLHEGSTSSESDHSMAVVGFRTTVGQQTILRVASSFISLAQAEENLHELDGKSFDDVVAEGRAEWNNILGRIRVEDDSTDNLRTFYSCLYRSVLFPRDLSEITADGRRVHYSPFNGEVCEGYLFTDTGFWDTFRSLFPLLNLVYPDQNAKIQQGLVNTYLESGFLPEWASPGHRGCMVGNNSASVVADAYLKGVRGQDIETLWQAVVHGTEAVHPTVPSTGRLGWQYYNRLGYVPYNVGINENAARTLEYAYDDWCIWQLGRALGKPESEIDIYRRRASNYRNLFDPESGLMRGRNENGEFQSPFSPLKWGDAFTEGNSLHYTWSVFQDPAGLAALMGGEEQFTAALDRIFEIPPHFDDSYYGFPIHEIREMQIMNMGNYAHGNQPIQHMIYLYNWGQEPWKSQQRIRQVMQKLYSSAPDGYCGDEDNGQTSAWYVFSALGFYPVCPATDQYVLGTPLFRKVSIALQNGKTVVIDAANNSSERCYIDRMKLNGRTSSKRYLTHSELLQGAHVEFTMSDTPNRRRSISADDYPYSLSNR